MIWLGLAIIVVVALVFGMRSATRGAGAALPFRPGSRAFEAALSLASLETAIEERKQSHEREPDPKRKDRLARELVYLEMQVPRLQGIVDSGDGSAGHGFVGFDNLPDDPA